MEALRKLVNLLALLFILIAALILFNILSIDYLDGNFTNFNPQNFYHTMFAIGTGVLLLFLLISNMHTLGLKRALNMAELRINELKAKLYDHKAEELRISNISRPVPSEMPPITPPDSTETR